MPAGRYRRRHRDSQRYYERCLAIGFIGGQYEWLARYCRQHGIDGMELTIHRDDKARELLAELIGPSRDQLDPRFAGDARYELFKSFRFPLFDVTKREMQAGARERRLRRDHATSPGSATAPATASRAEPAIPASTPSKKAWVNGCRPADGRDITCESMPRVRHWLARHPDLYMRVRALYRRLRSSSVAPPRALGDLKNCLSS